jgi:hypothetical protein
METNKTLCASCIEAGVDNPAIADYLPNAPLFAPRPICHECYVDEAYDNDYPNNYKADYLGVLNV